MPGPKTGPCGGVGEPACPPTPAALPNVRLLYSLEEMQEYGQLNYQKGVSDTILAKYKKNQGHQGAL